MALYLAVLGGVAVVEVHRAITGGSKDVEMLKKREDVLRKQLQDIQSELLQTKEQRQLSEAEAVQLSAINEQLQREKEDLSKQTESLQAQNEELITRADRLLERQQLLEQCAESLKLENSILIQQFDRLKIKYDQESAAFQEKLSDLKQNVSSVLQKFTQGDISAEQLIKFLGDMGVELRCPTGDVEKLPQRLAIASTSEERTEALDKVELKVDDNWIQQMKLVTMNPERAALLMSGAGSNTPRTDTAPAPAAAPQLEQRRLATPPRAREAQAALKIASHALDEASPPGEKIGAVHAVSALTAAETEATAPVDIKEAKDGKTSKARSLLFRPAKKAGKKGAKGTQQLLEMPLDDAVGASAVPRLAFDAGQDQMMQGQGNTTLMAL